MNKTKVYFLGIGGIGMSALARFFAHEGWAVAGYDRTPSVLTQALDNEGITVTFGEAESEIPENFRSADETLVIYTPAVPADHPQWRWFREHGFEIRKRSQVLGFLSCDKYVIAVAGTHGKTTTSTMIAWFNHIAGGGGSAFLGGISKNFNSNLVLGPGNWMTVEADEFDRSFLQLSPDVAVITAADPDHLDIYGTPEAFREAFSEFVDRIKPGGTLLMHTGVDVSVRNGQIARYSYAMEPPADFYAANIRAAAGGHAVFDLVCPDRTIADCSLGILGRVNIENSVAAAAALWVAGPVDDDRLREAMASFRGVKRRFDLHINTPCRIYMDDYAHHPQELQAAIGSFRAMFPGKKLTVVFQPHLYTRTRDFFEGFAAALSKADEVLLLPIYPAREEPIPGVTSEMLLAKITVPAAVVQKEELLDALRRRDPEALITFGAGDIDRFCEPITDLLNEMDAK